MLKDCKLEEWSLQEITTTLKSLGYKGIVNIQYVKNEFELGNLVQIKNDEDALALARIALKRNLRSVYLYIFHGYDHGNGVILTKIEPIIKSSDGGGEEYRGWKRV